MLIKQMSVFVENTTGRLAELTRILAQDGVDIKAACIADTVDFGILRCIVSDPEQATKILKNSGFTASITEVIAVEIADKPGGLAVVLDIFSKESIGVDYIYSTIRAKNGAAVIVVKTADPAKAVKILQEKNIPLCGMDVLE
jgi:hypothetical protein